MNRAEQAVQYKHSGSNCCQAVLKGFADKLPLDETMLSAIGSGFGTGMGCLSATCGALCGAVMAAGMLNDSGKPTILQSRVMLKEFEQQSGATLCGDLKGVKTGIVLCECDDCVRNAVHILEKMLDTENAKKTALVK